MGPVDEGVFQVKDDTFIESIHIVIKWLSE